MPESALSRMVAEEERKKWKKVDHGGTEVAEVYAGEATGGEFQRIRPRGAE